MQLLREMIAIPSVNPMRPQTGEPVERAMVDYIENVLRRADIDCERQIVAEGRENVIAIVHSGNNSKRNARDGLMLNSHMDTVPVANMAIDPFDPVLSDGRVYGRGSCDAKGSIAAMLEAFIAYANKRDRPSPVVFAGMADEEFLFSGSWNLIKENWPVTACVIGEPTKLARVIAHKGVARWRIKVRGVSAHGAMPDRGRNAIYDAARVVLALEEYAEEVSTVEPHPLLGPPTLNVGRVKGGQAVNIVPDLCEFEIERRLLPGEDARKAVQDCESFVREHIGEEIEFITEEAYLLDPPLDTPRDAAVVESIGAALRAELGTDGPLEGAHYGTDGSKLASVGIQTVVCGPGDIAQAHTSKEFIEVGQVKTAVRVYSHLLANWA
jgi:acetylornithine deacetylase